MIDDGLGMSCIGNGADGDSGHAVAGDTPLLGTATGRGRTMNGGHLGKRLRRATGARERLVGGIVGDRRVMHGSAAGRGHVAYGRVMHGAHRGSIRMEIVHVEHTQRFIGGEADERVGPGTLGEMGEPRGDAAGERAHIAREEIHRIHGEIGEPVRDGIGFWLGVRCGGRGVYSVAKGGLRGRSRIPGPGSVLGENGLAEDVGAVLGDAAVIHRMGRSRKNTARTS